MDKKRSLSLLAILLLGLFFRLYDLRGESLWLDEALSIEFATLNLRQIFFLHDTSPPFYYTLLHWWIYLFGVSEFSVRVPSVIFGVLSILMMYKIGSLMFDPDTGFLGSLLMAFSVFHIQYSQEARTYSLSVFLTLLSVYFFIKLLKEVSYRNLIGYVIFSILLIYSHIYGLFIIIAQNIYFIVLYLLSKEDRKMDVKKWSLIQSLLILLFAPWVSAFAYQVSEVQKGFWIQEPNIVKIISAFKMFSSKSDFLLLLFLFILIFSFVLIEKKQTVAEDMNSFRPLKSNQWRIRLLRNDEVLFLFIWMTIPVFLPFVISLFSQPIYVPKYTIVASPAFYLLVARGTNRMRLRFVKLIIIGIAIIVSLLSIRGYYDEINKEQWREVAKYVDTNAHSGDMLLFNAEYCMKPYKYYSRNDLVKKGFPKNDRDVDEKNINTLWAAVENYDRVWVILSHSGDKKELIAKTLMKSYRLSNHAEFKLIKVYLFEKESGKTAL